ncbi:hypothetical protein GCM10017744_004020 [Streptomyces antimycoticus]|uniref:Uncharacterized protein n=1 Tax=Streptomyces antimycoticus TaxID=68175 RepID=A0A4D4KQ46_9ACTN|nr:hypothetical protein SANT12839_095620 [Streptomyces antimycoticus]
MTLPGHSKSSARWPTAWTRTWTTTSTSAPAPVPAVLNTGRSSERAQLKQGYLDQNTSLAILSVGGNDARSTDLITKCVLSGIVNRQAESLDNVDPDNGSCVRYAGPRSLWKAWNEPCPERYSPSRERQSQLWRYSYATSSSAPAMPPHGPRNAQTPTAAHGEALKSAQSPSPWGSYS